LRFQAARVYADAFGLFFGIEIKHAHLLFPGAFIQVVPAMHDPLQEYPESVCLKNDLLRSNKQILLTMNFPDIRRCKLGPVVSPGSFEFQDIVFKAADVKLPGQGISLV